MITLALSGWQQPHDALKIIAPDALHVNYGALENTEALWNALAQHQPETLIGWSLGGLLAVQAVAKNILRPKKLVLLGAPFQFVASPEFPAGMPQEMWEGVKKNYAADARAMLAGFLPLIAQGDGQEKDITAMLQEPLPPGHWGYWLEQLGALSCRTIDLSQMPSTLIIHGENDAVIPPFHARAFKKSLPNVRVEIWKNCGHAPHWHDAEKLRERMHVFG